MKSEWKTTKLCDICTFHNGLWKGKKPPYTKAGIIRNTNFTKNGNLDYSDIPILDVETKQLVSRQLQFGDIIIEKSGGGPKQPVGRVAIFTKKDRVYSFSNFTSVIRIKNFSEVSFEYLHRYLYYFYISGNTEQMQSHSTGIRNLDFNKYKNLNIPIPPLSEQKRIVSILDDIFKDAEKAKEIAEKNLQNAKDLFESYMENVFSNPGEGWESGLLGDLCSFYNGKAHEKCIDAKGKYIVVNSKFIATEGAEYKKTNNNLFPLQVNDIVMVMSDVPNGKALAKCYLIDQNNLYSLNQRICAIRSNQFLPKFLFFQLNRNKHFLQFDNKENQTNLRKNDILACRLYKPAMAIQQEIANKLDIMKTDSDNIENKYLSEMRNIESLKKSVLNKAFSGEL